MKKSISLLFALLTCCACLLAATVVQRANYRHVRTNKKAWVRIDATETTDSIYSTPEIYVSPDSVLIASEFPMADIDVTITMVSGGAMASQHTEQPVFSRHYECMQTEERISIVDFPESIYKISIREYTADGSLFGYFAKGTGYEQEIEVLDVHDINVTKDRNVVYDLFGKRVKGAGKGVYVVGGKKVLFR